MPELTSTAFFLAQQAPEIPPVVIVIYVAVVIFAIAGMWACFAKAGKPGWAAIVPIYNLVVLLEIAEKPIWWVLLCLIPLVNIVILFIVYIDFAKAYGKGAGFGVGLALLSPIFFPILGFGGAQYVGVGGRPHDTYAPSAYGQRPGQPPSGSNPYNPYS